MKPTITPYRLLACALVVAVCDMAEAHLGRRLLIEVVDGKLQTQGVNTGPDDGAPAIRPYPNAIHDHWRNVESLGIATASLPGFDVSPAAATALQGSGLELRLDAVLRWRSPPMHPDPGHTPRLEPLAAGQVLTIDGPTETLNSENLGALTLLDEVPFGGVADLDLIYGINALPTVEIHVLRFGLTATPIGGRLPTVAASDPIYVLLSPDGDGPVERLHHASLFLENYLATVPEPSTGSLAILAAITLGRVRSRRRT